MSSRVTFFEAHRRHSWNPRMNDPRTAPDDDRRIMGRPGMVTPVLDRFRASSGTDTFTVDIPANHRYRLAVVVTLPPSANGATAMIESQPARGATGRQEIKVRWSCPPLREVRYRIKAYASSSVSAGDSATPEPETEFEELHIVNHGSVERLVSLMNGREHIRVVFTGPDVERLLETGLFGQTHFPPTNAAFVLTGAETVIVIMILAGAGVAAWVMAALTAVMLTGMAIGYRIDIKEAAFPSVADQHFGRLELELIPPGDD